MEIVLLIGVAVLLAALLIRFVVGGRSNRPRNRSRRTYWSNSVDGGSYDSGSSSCGSGSSSCSGGSSSSCGGGGGCGGGSS